MPDRQGAQLGQLAAAFAAGAAAAAGVAAALARRRAWAPAARVPRPHPGWAPPARQPPPHDPDAMLHLDPAALDRGALYALAISAVVPRPVGFTSTLSSAGAANLSPYSYFNIMCHSPPLLALGICRAPGRGGGKKDTLANIEATGEFVVNIMSEWFVEAANHTCGDFAPGVDEFEQSGLQPAASHVVAPPRVREAAVQMECKLRSVLEYDDAGGKPSSAIVIGEVVMFHVSRAVTGASPSGKVVVDPVKLAPVCRLGGVTYGRVTALYDMPRPDGQGRYPAS
ncbi:ywrF [Scenedesmus sp. PABB004]|nr:ywrF [Scenedesmus sp. PABB004]